MDFKLFNPMLVFIHSVRVKTKMISQLKLLSLKMIIFFIIVNKKQ